MWQCPECGRQFVKVNQPHTCTEESIENHFTGKSPGAKILFDMISNKVQSFGEVSITPVKNSIKFVSGYTFAVILVQQSALSLKFVIPYEINDKRIIKKVQTNKSDLVHFIKIKAPEDIDNKLLGWLKNSYKYKQRK